MHIKYPHRYFVDVLIGSYKDTTHTCCNFMPSSFPHKPQLIRKCLSVNNINNLITCFQPSILSTCISLVQVIGNTDCIYIFIIVKKNDLRSYGLKTVTITKEDQRWKQQPVSMLLWFGLGLASPQTVNLTKPTTDCRLFTFKTCSPTGAWVRCLKFQTQWQINM